MTLFFMVCCLNFLELVRLPWVSYDWYTSVWRKSLKNVAKINGPIKYVLCETV